jgi:hypothetical protein
LFAALVLLLLASAPALAEPSLQVVKQVHKTLVESDEEFTMPIRLPPKAVHRRSRHH